MSQVDVRHPAASQQAQDLIAFVKQFAYHSVITSDRYYHWHVSEPHLGSLISRPAVINATRILHRFSAAWITVRTIGAATFLSLIHISEPTRLRRISYAVFCLKKK